jgi:hypothetical protein
MIASVIQLSKKTYLADMKLCTNNYCAPMGLQHGDISVVLTRAWE